MMALSYSYTKGNIVPRDEVTSETTTYGHGEDPHKHTQAKRKIHSSLLLHLVSFTAVVWLVVQVVQLDDELVGLRSGNPMMGGHGWYDGQHQPSEQADAESVQDTNVKWNTGMRSRRRLQHVDDADSYSYQDYNTLCRDGPPSLHVVGSQLNKLDNSSESWFTFHTSNDTVDEISHGSLKFVHNQFIEITIPGYYFVYSQICYAGNGNPTGHEMVVKPDCGDATELPILESRALQVPPGADQESRGDTDSGYGGGVFYLATNDRVGVRPRRGGSTRFTKDNRRTSYFGAFLLSKSGGVGVDPDLRRCP